MIADATSSPRGATRRGLRRDIRDGVAQRGDVRGRRAAASADGVHAEVGTNAASSRASSSGLSG